MYTKYTEVLATVWFSFLTGHALFTIDIGQDYSFISGTESLIVCSHFQNFGGQFMTQDSWIRKKGLIPFKSMEIGSANSNPFYLQQSISGCYFRLRFGFQ